VTAHFNAQISKLCIAKGIAPDQHILTHFDCRLAAYVVVAPLSEAGLARGVVEEHTSRVVRFNQLLTL
jgi:hypothetical protein